MAGRRCSSPPGFDERDGLLFSRRQLHAHVIGILSLIFLAAALVGLYVYHLAGSWRWIYVVGAVVALYFNVFVGIVQAFMKVPFLQPLAPTQSEPPFLVAQLAVMAIFIVLGILAARRFHPTGA